MIPRSTTIQSGTDATTSAVTPEGTVRSARTTSPFPPRSRKRPTVADPAISRNVARSGSPRSTNHRQIRIPAVRKRIPALRSGGKLSTANAIARYVDPQTR